MSDPHSLYQVANRAVDLAVPIFKQPGDDLSLTAKGDRDYATEADYEIERVVRAHLQTATPEIGFLGEEEGQTGNASRTWCLDPIDGTVNYVHRSPLSGISLALLEEGTPTVGVIHFPWLGHRYQAYLGGGARRNGEPLQASGQSDLHNAVVAIGDYAVGADSGAKNDRQINLTDTLARHALRVRMHGSAAIDLAWLADGKIDATITLSNNPWDVSAGVLIAREAGAEVTGLDGETHTTASKATIGASTELIDQLLKMIGSSESPSA